MSIKAFRCAWLGAVAVGFLAFVMTSALAEETDAALAAAVGQVPTTLSQGLNTSEKTGKPISAKFEIEGGKLHLSVYTIAGDGYTEVVVAPNDGAVSSAETITDADDLKVANGQKAAIAKATMSLSAATDEAVGQNPGSRAISIFPELKDGKPMAIVTVARDGNFTTIPEPLN